MYVSVEITKKKEQVIDIQELAVGEVPLFLPMPSFMASADRAWGGI